jgi:hypothetical protein
MIDRIKGLLGIQKKNEQLLLFTQGRVVELIDLPNVVSTVPTRDEKFLLRANESANGVRDAP